MKETSSQSPLFLFWVLQHIATGTHSLEVIGKIRLVIKGDGTNPACHPHSCMGPLNGHIGTPTICQTMLPSHGGG